MANILKVGKEYKDPRDHTKDIGNSVYAVVTQININHTKRTGLVVQEIYPRACTREERIGGAVRPLAGKRDSFREDAYDEFFAKEKFVSGYNPQKAAYKFLANLEIQVEKVVEVEKEDSEGNKVTVAKAESVKVKKYADWKSDEL